jgi:hypothetical protein
MSELTKLFEEKEPETLQKLRDLVKKHEQEADPLVRWCTKPGCPGLMRGESLDAKKVVCPKCSTEVCFQCRDEWHGRTSCEQNMNSKLEGWADQHGGVRFCPVCRTKVEKNEGCNHMTCIICRYEFCWFCLGYAAHDAHHFDPWNPRSCGAGQFDRTATRWPIINYLKFVALIVIGILFIPLIYVLYFVVGGFLMGGFIMHDKCGRNPCAALIGCIVGVILGTLVGALLSPFALLIYLLGIVCSIGYAIYFIFRSLWFKVVGTAEPEEERNAKAQALLKIQEKIRENKKLVE